MSTCPTPTRLSFDEADERLDEALSDALHDDEYDTVLLLDGDVDLDGDLLAVLAAVDGSGVCADGSGVDLVAITGDLTVSGSIALYDRRPGLYVAGTTRAQALERGDAEIHLQDCVIEHLVHERGLDGVLAVRGAVQTPWVILSGCLAASFDAPGAYEVDDTGDTAIPVDFSRETIAASFVSEVVDAGLGIIVIPAFRDRLRTGLPVLRAGVSFAAETATAHRIAVARAAREPELDLGYSGLRSLPAEVLAMPWLRRLVLDGNRIGHLPEEIDALPELAELSVRSCGLATLPASIGELTGLRTLRVADNWTSDIEADPDRRPIALPETIGRLTNLEELDVSRLSTRRRGDTAEDATELPEPTPYPLPDSAGGLVRLRRLVADGTNLVFPPSIAGLASIEEISLAGHGVARLHRIPDTVATFPNLTRLSLHGNPLRGLPAELLRLPRLAELDLGGALGRLGAPLPDLSGLRGLRVLRLSGDGLDPRPPNSVLRPLFGMDLPALEALDVSGWGATGDRRTRSRMTADVIAGIGSFRALRRLDLSGNGLGDLPEDAYTLPALEWIDLQYNRLSRAARRRLCVDYPAAHIDFRDQVPARAEREEAQTVTELARQVRELAVQKRWAEALAGCERALAHYRDGLDLSADLLFLHYVKMRVHNARKVTDTGPESRRAQDRHAVAAAETCLRLLSDAIDGSIEIGLLSFGELAREAFRHAANTVAWRLLTVDPPAGRPELERALTLTTAAVAYVSGGDHLYLAIADTHVRLLLATGHEGRAWVALDRALTIGPGAAELKELRADPRYQARRSAPPAHTGDPSP